MNTDVPNHDLLDGIRKDLAERLTAVEHELVPLQEEAQKLRAALAALDGKPTGTNVTDEERERRRLRRAERRK